MVDELRRKILATGAAATALTAVESVLGQQPAKEAGAMSFYEKGPVRIRYQEAGSGFPLLLIPGGGLNSVIAGLSNPFDSLRRIQGRVPLHRGGSAQRHPRPVLRSARYRPPLGFTHG